MNHRLGLIGVLIFLNVLWSPVNFFLKLGMADGASPVAIAGCRWTILSALIWIGLTLLQVQQALKVKLPKGRDALQAILAGFLFVGPSHAIYYTALQQTTTAETVPINCTGPFWTTILAMLFLKEKVTPLRWMAILGGTAGAYLIAMGFGFPDFSTGHAEGNLMYLGAVIIESCGFIVAMNVLRRSSAAGSFAYQMLGNALALMILPLLFPGVMPFTLPAITPNVMLAIGYLVVFAGLIAWGGWYMVAEKTPVSFMLGSLGVQAPIGVAIGCFALKEPLGNGLWAGIALILGSLALMTWDARHHELEIAQSFAVTNSQTKRH